MDVEEIREVNGLSDDCDITWHGKNKRFQIARTRLLTRYQTDARITLVGLLTTAWKSVLQPV